MHPPEEATETELREEEKRIRRLQKLVDFSLAFIAQADISLEEAQAVVQGVRYHAHLLFPDKKETFELIYTPRFRRLISEKFALQ